MFQFSSAKIPQIAGSGSNGSLWMRGRRVTWSPLRSLFTSGTISVSKIILSSLLGEKNKFLLQLLVAEMLRGFLTQFAINEHYQCSIRSMDTQIESVPRGIAKDESSNDVEIWSSLWTSVMTPSQSIKCRRKDPSLTNQPRWLTDSRFDRFVGSASVSSWCNATAGVFQDGVYVQRRHLVFFVFPSVGHDDSTN